MSFAALPVWAVLVAMAATLVGVLTLYLLRRTPRREVVSNVAFWLRAAQRSRPKFLRATRIPLIALLVSMLIGSLLVADLSDPRFGAGVRGTTVVVYAAGRTMGAREGLAGTRLAQALGETARQTERASSRGRVAVIRAGLRPTVVLPLTEDGSAVGAALRGERADDGPSDLAGALLLADGIVRASGESGRIVVIADRPLPVATGAPLELIPIGTPRDTIAVTRLIARRDPVAVGEYAVHAEVTSFTSRTARAKLVIRDRDVVLAERELRLGPYEHVSQEAQGFSSGRGELTAKLEDIVLAGADDALAADDTAYAAAPPLHRTSVLLVTSGNPFLQRVLAAHGALDVTIAAPGAVPDGALSRFEVVVLDRAAPEALLRHPAKLLVASPDGTAGFAYADAVHNARVTATLAGHGALDGVRLDGVLVREGHALRGEPGDSVLARRGADALIIARERAGERTVALGFALDRTDLVERIAFPLMMHATLRWLAGQSNTDVVLARSPGTPLAVGRGATALGPGGEALTPVAGVVVDTARAGLYHVGEEVFAYDASPQAETLAIDPTGRALDPLRALPPLSALVAGVLLALVLLEWLLLHRGRLG
jgi:hypothetical protein